MAALVQDLIDRIKRDSSQPTDDTLFTTDDYTALLNECMTQDIYPKLITRREDYGCTRTVVPLQVNGNDQYRSGIMPLPQRAWNQGLREVRYIDNGGNYYPMNLIYLETLPYYYLNQNVGYNTAIFRNFIIKNNAIQLTPVPYGDPGSIEFHYIIQPSLLLNDSTAYSPISNLVFNPSTNATTYTVSMTGQTYLQSYCPVNQIALFDIYDSVSGFLVAVSIPLQCLSTSQYLGVSIVQPGTNILYPDPIEVSNFQLGGFPTSFTYNPTLYLVPAGQNSFSSLTTELDKLLVYSVICNMATAQTSAEDLAVAMKKRDDLAKEIFTATGHRIDGESQVFAPIRGVRAATISNSSFYLRRS